MPSSAFFFGNGKIRYWYILFYIFALPVYIFGIYLLTKLHENSQPETRDMVLTIFAFGYLLLGIFSLINTIIYTQRSKNFFWGFFVFLGIQVIFWFIGEMLGNNYLALTLFFTLFLFIAVYGNLTALSYIHKKNIERKHNHIKE